MEKEQLNNLRHSCAHLLAAAVMELWPKSQPTLGPPIEDGFYYDFDFSARGACLPVRQGPASGGNDAPTEKDFLRIEEKMKALLPAWAMFSHELVSADQARESFTGNLYKQELIDEIVMKGEPITLYTSGGFTDLCRGGHCENPAKELKHFKLLSVAGAYWRGSEKNKMLTRIYGTCFPTPTELEAHLAMLEEAKKRDHRKIGKELDLFTFSELVGPGLPLWTPKGTMLRTTLDDFVWELRRARGYEQVTIPHITRKELYETSGHWQKFSAELFHITTREGHEFAMKPMNCPHHTQIFDRLPRSYRDMPQRYAETTMCYRDEQTGELHGLSRVRAFTQDDAHVFCRRSQVKEEFLKIWDIVDTFYVAVGFGALKVRLSLHDPDKFEKYLGTPELWQQAEAAIRDLARERGVAFVEAKGEAAFYGPKVDFIAKDSIGREWQVATIQLDINQPERFNLSCINEQGEKERIVMIHAAIMGSIERFLSIIIEHHAGAFPVWLSPVQVQLAPVAERHVAGAQTLAGELLAGGIRVAVDDANETVGNKVRKAANQKIPYIIVVGDKELAGEDLMIRIRGQEKQEKMGKVSFMERVRREIEERKC